MRKAEMCKTMYGFSYYFNLIEGFLVFVLNMDYIPKWNDIV